MTRPSDTDLTLYALGALDPPEQADVERQLAADASLRAELERVRDTLALVPSAARAPAPPPDLRARVLGITDPQTRFHGFADRLSRLFDLPSERARAILAAFDGATGWEPGPAPGVELYHVDGGTSVADADVGLVRFAPGTVFPMHTHKGEERMFFVQGSAVDDTGHEYNAGDVLVSKAGATHSFRVTSTEAVLFAIVLWEGIELV